ncbi:hypothetical protein JTB14_000512 [Gonioctena quinquepunctata]|nr:hypothetical protein JTB14_000512 [Gonioctena quinquepunctata]
MLNLDQKIVLSASTWRDFYTNVPIEESLSIIKRKLEEDDQLHERTDLPTHAILELLQCCLQNSYFQEKDRFFSQVDGLQAFETS